MSLTLSAIDHGQLCHGFSWTITDEDTLSQRVARVALGQYRHVSKILGGAGVDGPSTSAEQAKAAISLLTVEPNEDPWHRDGWIFQTISWIAAHRDTKGVVTRPPHIIKAHKGFDGLQLELSADGKAITAVVIFEDKATDNARQTIREDVLPGIAALEAGDRANELTHEVNGVLDAQARLDPGLDVDAAISNIMWKEARYYRVSITVGKTHSTSARRAKLFKGFDENAPGDVKRRRAETMYVPELRKWMDQFANRVIEHIKSVAVANV
ncbi:MAG: hypothetical protein WDM86_09230 [Rhizomicrobium sp.]